MASPVKIELLAPARTADIGISAIRHGADAVYIGPPAFGARQAAANSIEDIRRLVDFAHAYRARVYATLNTLLFPDELSEAERVAAQLYHAGVDALIVQDMGLLRLDLPHVELHASTQCDIRTAEKAIFLQKAGFSQIVLARELTLGQIEEICSSVDIQVETFVHGALCVSYSGRCSASQICMGRSANRGACAQMCRLPYTLADAEGNVMARDRHLLSLHDLNLSDRLLPLLKAGVTSFKIEGRLKDENYVKNIVSHYRNLLDGIIAGNQGIYERSSCGSALPEFIPDVNKSFNRGFTHYFLDRRKPMSLTSPLTPKSLGEKVTVSDLHAGDGIAYVHKGVYTGKRVNKAENGRIHIFGGGNIPDGVELRRTFDKLHSDAVARSNPQRKLWVDMELADGMAYACDERGLRLAMPLPEHIPGEKNSAKIREIFCKTGSTVYTVRGFREELPENIGYAPSVLTTFRRTFFDELDRVARITYPCRYRRSEQRGYPYPCKVLGYADNVSNPKAEEFYRGHGVESIEPALESGGGGKELTAMTCRHCILRELNLCLKTPKGRKISQPLTLSSGNNSFTLRFNCDVCEMQLLQRQKQ